MIERTLFFCMLLLVLGGCTWQELAYDARTVAADWRIVHSTPVDKSFRWRLPRDISLKATTASVPASASLKPWSDAAQRGLNRVYTERPPGGEQPAYTLLIDWPVSSQASDLNQTESWQGSILALHMLPELPRSGTLGIRLLDSNNGLIYHAQMQIRPSLLQASSWDDLTFIERAFYDLARSLRAADA